MDNVASAVAWFTFDSTKKKYASSVYGGEGSGMICDPGAVVYLIRLDFDNNSIILLLINVS